MRVYKILYDGIFRLEEYEAENLRLYQMIQQYLQNTDGSSNFSDILDSQELQEYCAKLIQLKNDLKEKSELSKFWLSFLDMIEILLHLNFAIRTGHWDLYVEAVNGAFPWFFAYDRQNYSRYLTTH